MTDLSEVFIKHGPKHEEMLKSLSVKLRGEAINEGKIFSAEAQSQVESFAKSYSRELPSIFTKAFKYYHSSQASKAPGHEETHVIDTLNSALGIFDQYSLMLHPLSEIEKFEIALTTLTHDIGRYAETSFRTGYAGLETITSRGKINEKDLEIIVPVILGRRFAQQLNLPEALNERILYNIASGTNRQTGHLLADLVHQCDREQLSGVVMIPRLVALGVGVYGQDFLITPSQSWPDYSVNLPPIYTQQTNELLTRMEFWMRNVYLPVSPLGEKLAQRGKVEAATIIMLGTFERDDLRKIVFAPELKLVDQRTLNATKRPLSEETFQKAETNYQRFLMSVDLNSYSQDTAIRVALRLLKIEGNVIPENFEKNFRRVQNQSDSTQNCNRWLIMLYALQQRHETRVEDIARLKVSQIGMAEATRQIVLENLEERETVYNELSRTDNV